MPKLKLVLREKAEPITHQDLKHLEAYADRLFKEVGMDISFTKHFLERANDARNKTQITVEELQRLFREEYAKWGKKISNLKGGAEAILKDMQTNINVPFVLKWDASKKMLDLVSKTVMRKKDFKSPDRAYVVEDAPVNNVGSGAVAGMNGEGGSQRKMLRRGKFAGNDTFIVPTKTFNKARFHKKHQQHWKTYLGMDEETHEIREYANKNPHLPIVLQDEGTGAMMFSRYGKKRR